MKILFIYFNKEFRPRTLVSLSILETIAKKAGHQTKIFDTSFYQEFMDDWSLNTVEKGMFKVVENLDIPIKTSSAYGDLKAMVEDFEPDMVCFSYYRIQQDMQHALLTPLKRDFPHITIFAGGPEPCINPRASLNEPYLDMICYGEGEVLLQELCSRMDKGESLDGLPGLWRKLPDGSVVDGGIAPINDLDDLPVQDWDSYPEVHIHGLYEGRAYRMGHVEFTRGCPYNCSYCGSGSIRRAYERAGRKQGTKKRYVRHKSPAHAVAEYKALKEKYGLEMFYFVDGTFNCMPLEVLREFSRLYKEQVNVPFIALVRPEAMSDEVARLMKEMNCIHVSVGVESGDAEYRKRVFNRKQSDKRIVAAIQSLKKVGIHVSAYNIIGVPGMDRKHVFKTIALNKKAQPDSAIVSIFIPFPDNDLTMSLIDKGLMSTDDIHMTDGSTPKVRIKDMTTQEIEGLYKTFNLYVRYPKIAYPFIRLLESPNPLANRLCSLL